MVISQQISVHSLSGSGFLGQQPEWPATICSEPPARPRDLEVKVARACARSDPPRVKNDSPERLSADWDPASFQRPRLGTQLTV